MDQYINRVINGPAFSPQEEMQYESVRLSSYVSWPIWGAKRPTELADNGFYYSGDGDRVVCFCCEGEISNWTSNDDIKDRHRETSPQCALVNGAENANHGMSNVDVKNDTKEAAAMDSFESKDLAAFFPKSCSVNGPSSMEDVDRELSSVASANSLEEVHPPKKPKEKIIIPETNITRTAPGMGPIDEVNTQFVMYESYRLRTFEGKWSEESFISPASLAKAGFYFLSEPDRVQCAFCEGRLQNWRSTDVPMSEHRLHFPSCPFVMGRSNNNVSLEDSQSSVQIPKAMRESENPLSKSEKLGVVQGRSKHPEFSTLSKRLDTFKTWPKKTVIPPASLAESGFYYVGYSDNVKCFFCDGGLRNWDACDEPWREHARWFAKCGFLKLQKGEDYIQNVLSENTQAGVPDELPSASAPMLPRGIDSQMARTVIAMGFEKELVERVILSNRTETGNEFAGASQLLDALVKEEEICEENETTETHSRKLTRRQKRNRKSKEMKHSPSDEAKTSEEAIPENMLKEMVEENPDVQTLLQDYQRVRDERMCKVCIMDKDCVILFLPCGHLVCCADCAPALRDCPVCRTLIKGAVRVYQG